MSDLDTLVDMGFEKERAELAVKQTGGLQGAIDWLDKNQDKSLDEIKEDAKSASDAAEPSGELLAKSLLCKECGKMFRTQLSAEAHAERTEHVDFEESTEEIAPLTEEQKKEKLAELRERAALKKKAQSKEDEVAMRRNAAILSKSNKEQQDAKDQLAQKQAKKEAEEKRKEKHAEIEAKKRIQAKIAADKEERRLKSEREKAQRAGQTFPTGPIESSMPAGSATPSSGSVSKKSSAYTETRLRLQTPAGTVQKTFPIETTLFEVAHSISEENGTAVQTFATTFPKKTWDHTDFGMTLKEAGMVPSAALIVS